MKEPFLVALVKAAIRHAWCLFERAFSFLEKLDVDFAAGPPSS
jgi:hypothetical protein